MSIDREVDDLFEGLARYRRRSDRATPLVFAGRKDELRELEGVAADLAERQDRGMFRVVHGLPGRGKTALCEHFLASIHGRKSSGHKLFGVQLDPADLDQPPLRLVAQITDLLSLGALRDGVAPLLSGVRQILGKRRWWAGLGAQASRLHAGGTPICVNLFFC